MSSVPYFTNLQCESALVWGDLIDHLEDGMKNFSLGKIEQPVREMLTIDHHKAFYGLMPCRYGDVMSVKCVSLYPENGKKNLPTHIVYVLLFESLSGRLLGIMEGEGITKRRTAATSALSARWLAPESPRILGILGSGHQGLAHMQVLLNQYPSIEEVRLWNYRKSSAVHLASEVGGWLSDGKRSLTVCDSVRQCVKDADLVVTATFASEPVLDEDSDLKRSGVHVMAVGAARPNLAEISPAIWNSSDVYVDSMAGAKKESGDIIYSKCAIEAEMGSFIEAGQPLNHRGLRRTMFKSLGLALQDLVAAKIVHERIGKSNRNNIEVKTVPKSRSRPRETLKEATTGVENLACKSKLVTEDILVCELQTSSASLSMIYKAETGQLKTILDGKSLENLSEPEKNGIYIQAYESEKCKL